MPNSTQNTRYAHTTTHQPLFDRTHARGERACWLSLMTPLHQYGHASGTCAGAGAAGVRAGAEAAGGGT